MGRGGHTHLGTRPPVSGGRCPDIWGVARVRTMPSEQLEESSLESRVHVHAILPSGSGSEFIPLSDRILLLVACMPRARVVRACAVGIARRGAQIGRLGGQSKKGTETT